ncbi:ribonucleoside-diphosphate reductase, adenosylcobalamin-dependent [Candidatus Micrarchaeota archaeon RBG_16_49_10]|nr:MAG: ribonucleoside-diphosphate reductase, adenosylcobalamin-dependent [Candidatus Micrarchaeota archaeon RBG_16_49_10]
MIDSIVKRDGSVAKFDTSKIAAAIAGADSDVEEINDQRVIDALAAKAVELVMENLKADEIPTVEMVQDMVEKTLIESGYGKVAKAYILYRQKRTEIRRIKKLLGVEDDLKLPINAIIVLRSRYLRRDETGKVLETPRELFERVARTMAHVERKHGMSAEEVKELEGKFYDMMVNFEFLPNSPTLMNAGTESKLNLSACFVLPVEDSIEGIFETIKNAAIIHQSGGGTGFAFSRLRPAGDIVKSTSGVASGPISFMKVFDTATEIIKQGGCISSDSLVRTDGGTMPIGNMLNCRPLSQNFTRNLVYDGKMFSHAFIAEDNGMAEVFRIRTEMGLTLESTYNHQIACVGDDGEVMWKDAHEIKEGDWLVVVLGGHKGADIELPPLKKQHFNSNPISIPERMNPELGEIMGLYMADGCFSTGGRMIFSIENKDEDVISRIESLMLSVFGLKAGIKENRGNYTDIIFYSRDLQRFFREMKWAKERSSQSFVPEAIFRSSRETAFAFLRGLFEGDGDVHMDGYPRLYTTSRRMVEGVQQLMLGLEIVSKYGKYEKGENSFGKLPIYQLAVVQERSIGLFKGRIGFISSRKNAALSERMHEKAFEQNDILPGLGRELKSFYNFVGRGSGEGRSKRGADLKFYRAIHHYISPNPSSRRNLTRKRLLLLMEKFPKLKSSKKLLGMADYRHFYTRVSGIERGTAFTMDIEVPSSGSFVANSILVHNKRRGANMAILRVDHPDILDFVVSKETEGVLRNFNISVAITDKFMKAVLEDKDYDLLNPRSGAPLKKMKARAVWNLIVTMAWKNGEPGVVFLDTINKMNPTVHVEEIESTNPCGEQPLGPYESCNLGSINLSKFVVNGGAVDWDRLREVVRLCVRFLDNVIDANTYPLKQLKDKTYANRRIGLGVMGFADMLIELGIKYDSEEGVKMGEKVMKFIEAEGHEMSQELGKEKGSFPNFKGSLWDKKEYKHMRNATVTTIAPTGTIGVIAGSSQGIEPLFAISYVRNVQSSIGYNLVEVNSVFENMAIREGIYTEELMKKLSENNSIQGFPEIPRRMKDIFVTAHDISPEWHVRIQAAFQKHTDNAVSKTINFPNSATPQDIERAYLMAYQLKCKGITVYRDGSRALQVLTTKNVKKEECEVC